MVHPATSCVDPEGRRHAVVLSGGGARAAFEVGALAALAQGASRGSRGWPLHCQIFCGSSLGAYHAAFLACHEDRGDLRSALETLTRIWRRQIARSSRWPDGGVYRLRGVPFYVEIPGSLGEDPFRSVLDTTRAISFWARFFGRRARDLFDVRSSLLQRVQRAIPVAELFDIEPFRELVAQTIDPTALSSKDTFVAVNLTQFRHGAPEVFFREQLATEQCATLLLASVSVPGLVPAVELNGRHYVDGTLSMEVPFVPAMAADADVLHVIRSWQPPHAPVQVDTSTLGTTLRMIRMIMEANIYNKLHSLRSVAEQVEALIDKERQKWLDPESFLTPLTFYQTQEVLRHWAPTLPGGPAEVHFYYLDESFPGTDGFLDFRAGRIDNLMAAGYRIAEDHDCRSSGCWLASTDSASHGQEKPA